MAKRVDTKQVKDVESLTESLESFSKSYDLYIVFIDLCDSTEFKNYCLQASIPDSIWIIRQYVFLSRTAAIIHSYDGNVVKTIGDEIMATFPIDMEPGKIIKCVIEVFQNFLGLKAYNKGKFIIKSKASIDYGTCYNGQILNSISIDPIGTCVDRCARLNKHAGPNEITFSEDFMDILTLSSNGDIAKYKISEQKENMKGLGEIKFFKISIK